MQDIWIQLLALVVFVFYPALPVMIIFIHKTLPFWRKMGTKSYYFFVFGFFVLFVFFGNLVFSFKDDILEWYLYQTPWAYLGLIPLVGGIILGAISIRTLSLKVLLGLPEIDNRHFQSQLIVRGIYCYIRHPRYLEFILEVFGITILSGLAWNFILFVLFVPAAFAMAYVEEQELIRRFGQEYLNYKKKTGFFLPKLNRSS